MTMDLFDQSLSEPRAEPLCEGAVVLRRFASANDAGLLKKIGQVADQAPFRQMKTPGGHTMSVAMTCCGDWGWVTHARGYRYQQQDPVSGDRWPAMPDLFRSLAVEAAAKAGYAGFEPDSCLVNRYSPGAKMGLHQDRDEEDFGQPIVSVSLGTPVTFQFGGMRRSDRPQRVSLEHGDVIVWGGPARLRYHGVLTLKASDHPLTGAYRYNLTFRRAH
ncbi:DNA oxidative demethylase AlkB [Marinobacter orientalis]|uniref:DNA oxidative demethylase AlkB n=1 Tax=Marinobacter orientalis TaxID=1928859 RepID=A0A7Y0RDN4_9GAMM|nr:DNA oxidative demethylase AlkB [Marinobacter orientalis]NMT64309.1 DNA oxidative demethylase AlkB [Marinobacter orientalis]TGX49522.1 DNA oxidative demethylase AlkB [Marinobacter orientalis]